jgi:hypothetical protein
MMQQYGWVRHDNSKECPILEDTLIEVETLELIVFKGKASEFEWEFVNFYRVIH